MKNYTTWLKTTAIIQFITAVVHMPSFFFTPPPVNDTEKHFWDLMEHYRFDLGSGFHRTFSDLTTALSSCFPLLCILAGLINWYLISKKVEVQVMIGIININLLVFGVYLIIVLRFAFLPPIVLIGLVFLSLVIARFTIKRA